MYIMVGEIVLIGGYVIFMVMFVGFIVVWWVVWFKLVEVLCSE